jgi:hypothetical protein
LVVVVASVAEAKVPSMPLVHEPKLDVVPGASDIRPGPLVPKVAEGALIG